MPSSKPALRYHDILDYIVAIHDDIGDMSHDAFIQDGRTHRSVIYSMQCISEAAKKLGDHAEEHAPEINWADIRGFGNWSRHGYETVDLSVVWDTYLNHLPDLEAAASRILDELEPTRQQTSGPEQEF